MAIEAIQMKKHTLVDKPMAIKLEEADEMIREVKNTSVKLGVNLQSKLTQTSGRLKAR